ncbi:hypothetical protein ONZ45_g14728 [Pleurotus djamor]|nr:hypothetical protein ONZ45_g14728 [Pleurotus djamor]
MAAHTWQNFTIDDYNIGQFNASVPLYYPPGAWAQGETCDKCKARLDPSQAFNRIAFLTSLIPHQLTLNAGNALYVYCIVSNNLNDVFIANSRFGFELDGVRVRDYEHNPQKGSDLFEYNTLVYSESSLQMGEHRFNMFTRCGESETLLMLFDYAIYTGHKPQANATTAPGLTVTRTVSATVSARTTYITRPTAEMDAPASTSVSRARPESQRIYRYLSWTLGALLVTIAMLVAAYFVYRRFIRKAKRESVRMPLNVTIDDEYGDLLTGALPSYEQADAWHQGNSCLPCAAKLNSSKTFMQTWHDNTSNGGKLVSMTFNFTAKELLDNIPRKWDPRRIEEDPPIPEGDEGWQDASMSRQHPETLSDLYRIFAQDDEDMIARETPERQRGAFTEVATDGSCSKVMTTQARAGAGVFFADADGRNIAAKVPRNLPQTNQVAELYAVHRLLAQSEHEANLHILCDSKYTISNLTHKAEALEDQGFINTANRDLIKTIISQIRERKGTTQFKWVKGHSGDHMNEGADCLADQGSKNDIDVQHAGGNSSFMESGAKLNKMTQKIAYQAIRERKLTSDKHRRGQTTKSIERIQNEVEDSTGEAPSEVAIWRAAKHKDFSRQTRFFIWMSIHNAYKIGEYWTRVVTDERYASRGECKHCNDITEDMAHILTFCEAPGQQLHAGYEKLKTARENQTLETPDCGGYS